MHAISVKTNAMVKSDIDHFTQKNFSERDSKTRATSVYRRYTFSSGDLTEVASFALVEGFPQGDQIPLRPAKIHRYLAPRTRQMFLRTSLTPSQIAPSGILLTNVLISCVA